MKMLDVVGYEGHYKISKFGDVYSMKSKIFLSHMKDSYGYHIVSLSLNGKVKKKKVHRLVFESHSDNLETFYDNGMTIDHIDRNKDNNDISNLRIATAPIQNSNKEYTKVQILCIKETSGEEIVFNSLADAARYGIGAQSSISNVINGRRRSINGWLCKKISN